MYVRRKPNRSGSTSVVVVEKKAGKVCYLKTIGVSSDQQEIDELMDLFGVFLLVLIGIELLDTIKVYLRRNVVHVEVVVLVAIIALARKVVVLKIEELSGNHILGIGVLIVSLSIAYYLIKKSGLLVCDLNDKDKSNALEKENE
ncbi:MAG: phosphate-starvation-inducible PsiE family protein [Salinivirgaceae bacterium]|nr:phosphate-starvation-inducible PsiE family protein [Salinivirgaceae bacterium]MDD4747299.1 phosphate-starvation-inducible PsiE family protein [Salinivirgaceae bacterium]